MDKISFAKRIKEKYPEYKDMDDNELADRVIAKYPQYKSQVKTEEPKKGLGQKILDAGTKVANFVGAKGISEQFGASAARASLPDNQDDFVSNPSLKEVVGSAVQTGANLIPGAGIGANLGKKVIAGALTGYATDVGGNLQSGTKEGSDNFAPGLATAVGAVLPVLGKVTGLDKGVANKMNKQSRTLEEINLRLTPKEKQDLAKKGKDIATYLSEKKIVGTPEARYAKIDAIYDTMEDKVQGVITSSGKTFNKKEIIEELVKIPNSYKNNLSEYDAIASKIDRIVNNLNKNFGDEIPGKVLNDIKRAEFKNAYSKSGVEVVNEVSNEVGDILKTKLETIPGLKNINGEYSNLILARKILGKATTRNQAGLFGRAAGLVGGTTIGGAVAGPGGAAVGAMVGPQLVNTVSTPVRSATGATLKSLANTLNKIPTDKGGKLQITRKALFQLLQNIR